ncbi:MAG: metallophosphoesterase [Polyangiaceae bacterium]|nr:metallophosphoesterase [Polyangiaceae bacterium]
MRWLCISDIHGDAAALAAVLATAERRGYDRLLVAGDLCFPGPEPLEVWRRLVNARATCVQGVTDRAIATLDPSQIECSSPRERERVDELVRVREALGDLILARLLKLEQKVRIPLPDGGELLLVHGSPADPTEPFTHDMSDDDVRALLGDDPADIIICGGSHVPFDRTVMGVRVVNVGSVGEALSGGGARHAEATFLEIASDIAGSIAQGTARAQPRPLTIGVEQLVIPLEAPAVVLEQ